MCNVTQSQGKYDCVKLIQHIYTAISEKKNEQIRNLKKRKSNNDKKLRDMKNYN